MSASPYPRPAFTRVLSLLRRALDPDAAPEGRTAAAHGLAALRREELATLHEDPACSGLVAFLDGLTSATRTQPDSDADEEPGRPYDLAADFRRLLNEAYATDQPLLPACAPGALLTDRARACAWVPDAESFDVATVVSAAATRLDRVGGLLLVSQRAPEQPAVWRAYVDAALSGAASVIPVGRLLARGIEDALALRPDARAWLDGVARWLEAYVALTLLHPAAPPAGGCDWGRLHLTLRAGVARRAQLASVYQPMVIALGELVTALAVVGAASLLDLRALWTADEADPVRAVEQLHRQNDFDTEKTLFESALGAVIARPKGRELARLQKMERSALVWAAHVVACDSRLGSGGLLEA